MGEMAFEPGVEVELNFISNKVPSALGQGLMMPVTWGLAGKWAGHHWQGQIRGSGVGGASWPATLPCLRMLPLLPGCSDSILQGLSGPATPCQFVLHLVGRRAALVTPPSCFQPFPARCYSQDGV